MDRKAPAAGALLAGLVLIAACGGQTVSQGDPVLSYRSANPTPLNFEVCYNHGCLERAEINLSLDDWIEVVDLFQPRSGGPAEERVRIQQAVALLETKVGARTGTDRDIGGTFAGVGLGFQLDCIDEAVNTTTYLMLLAQQELIHWHDFGSPATRGYFFAGWPHSTAVIADRETGRRYAVDAWFGDNGEQPAIVPLEDWYDGWTPPEA